MGCGGSKASSPAPPSFQSFVFSRPVDGRIVAPVAPHLLGPFVHKPRIQGEGKGKGKGMCKGKGKGSGNKWQIMLDGKFHDYGSQEDSILKRACMIGHQHAKFHLRGQSYEYNFTKMIQTNKDSGKERQVRPPFGWVKPKKPLLPQGPMIVITVGFRQPGTMIILKDPNNPGEQVQVYVPAHAKPGQKMAVPIPEKGQSVKSVQQKQKKHDAEHGTKTCGAGCAAIVGAAALGVGGVILGDHLADGDIADTIGDAAVDAGGWAADAAGDAADWTADAAGDAGDWAADAFGDAGEWLEAAVEEIPDIAADGADWLEDAGEDIGDFVMDLF